MRLDLTKLAVACPPIAVTSTYQAISRSMQTLEPSKLLQHTYHTVPKQSLSSLCRPCTKLPAACRACAMHGVPRRDRCPTPLRYPATPSHRLYPTLSAPTLFAGIHGVVLNTLPGLCRAVLVTVHPVRRLGSRRGDRVRTTGQTSQVGVWCASRARRVPLRAWKGGGHVCMRASPPQAVLALVHQQVRAEGLIPA